MSKFITLSKLKTALTPIMNIVNKKANESDLSTVAKTGSYNDLTDKPKMASSWNDLTDKPVFSTVATSGSWNDLIDRTHGEELSIVEILPKTTNMVDEYVLLPECEQLKIGEKYIVTLNDVIYECIAREYNYTGTIIGNGTIYGDGNIGNNEPFSCDSHSDGSIYLNIIEPGEYTISIAKYNTTIYQLDEKYIPDTIARTSEILQPDWNQTDSEQNDYIKNKPTLAPVATSGNYNDLINTPVLSTVAISGSYNDLTDKPAITSTFIDLLDSTQNIVYRIAMRDGNLTISSPISNISITVPPIKTNYFDGDSFDPTGMVVMATTTDSTSTEITDYTVPNPILFDGQSEIIIQYIDKDNVKHTTTVPVSVISLADFEYTANDDGTYTITGWK